MYEILWGFDVLVITLNIAGLREELNYQHETFRQKYQNIILPQSYYLMTNTYNLPTYIYNV